MKTFTFRTSALFAALTFAALAASPARAVQTSGSLLVMLDKTASISDGDVVTASIYLHNSSTNSPVGAPPLPPDLLANGVSAQLSGDVTVDVNCADCQCSAKTASFKLNFLPGGIAGCAAKAPAVTSCSAVGDQVTISLGGNSITASPHESVFLAQVKFTATVPAGTTTAPNVIQASTGECGLRACQNGASPCVDCAAQGCTAAFPTGGDTPCPHSCPSVITYNAVRPDTYTFHTLTDAVFTTAVNPFTEPVSISLTNANGEVFAPGGTPGPWTLPAGSMRFSGDGWRYNNSAAVSAGGIYLVKLARRDGLPDRYRLDVQIRDAALEANTDDAALSTMTLVVEVGGQTFTFGPLLYRQRATGWTWP